MSVGGIYKVIRFAAIDHILIPKWYRLSSGNCALLLIHNDVSVELSDDNHPLPFPSHTHSVVYICTTSLSSAIKIYL
jgi:hypothetical protein